MSGALVTNLVVGAALVAAAVVAVTILREVTRRRRRGAPADSMPAQLIDGRRLLAERLEEGDSGRRGSDARALLLAYLHGGTAVPGATDRSRVSCNRALLRALAAEFGHGDVYRLTSQQIAVVSRDGTETGARRQAERIIALAAAEPGAESVSVGMALRTPDSVASQLWAESDAALRAATERGPGAVVLHGDVARTVPPVTLAELDRLAELLDEGRVAITFQPVIALGSERLLGFQALSRPASRYGFESLGHAFAAASRVGRAADLDALCRSAVLDEGAGFDMPAGTLLFLSVSAAGLGHPSLQPGPLVPAVRAAGLSSDRVVLELREPWAGDPDTVAKRVRSLAGVGFQIALAGLGADRSGLEWLRHVPADFLKLDGALLAAAASDPLAEGLAHAICAMGERTGASVIAEGVESEELLAVAKRLSGPPTGPSRLHAAQGSHIAAPHSRPLDPRADSKAASARRTPVS